MHLGAKIDIIFISYAHIPKLFCYGYSFLRDEFIGFIEVGVS